MIRRFCDGCSQELTGASSAGRDQQGRLFGRVSIPGGRTMFAQVLTGTDSTWNAGDFCNVCIASALASALGSKDAEIIAPPHEL